MFSFCLEGDEELPTVPGSLDAFISSFLSSLRRSFQREKKASYLPASFLNSEGNGFCQTWTDVINI